MFYDPTDRPNGSIIADGHGGQRVASFTDVGSDLLFRALEVGIGAAAGAVGMEIASFFSRRRTSVNTPWSNR